MPYKATIYFLELGRHLRHPGGTEEYSIEKFLWGWQMFVNLTLYSVNLAHSYRPLQNLPYKAPSVSFYLFSQCMVFGPLTISLIRCCFAIWSFETCLFLVELSDSSLYLQKYL